MTNLFEHKDPFVFAVVSGKGGVGKSVSSVNLAIMLSDMGYRTAVIDADLGLSNCAGLLGGVTEKSVCDWIKGEAILEELGQSYDGVTLVTGAADPEELTIDNDIIMDALDQVTSYLSQTHDFILIDTPAGAGEMTLWALDTAKAGIMVLVDDPSSISDSYRLCKYIFNIDPSYPFTSLVNFADDEETALSTHQRFNTILGHFLDREIAKLGFLPDHKTIRSAVRQQKSLLTIEDEQKNEVLGELEFTTQNLISYANKLEQPVLKLVY